MAGFCDITDALAEAQFYILRRLNKKFEALRRLAELLEQLGDLSNLIPNISSLIPIVDINFDIYTNLVSNCPFLGLPNVNEASLEGLRNQVLTAYNTLTRDLLNHPWLRMGKLQDQLTKAQQQLNSAFAEGGQYLQCLQAACQAAQQTGQFLTRVSQTDISAEFSKFGTNFVQNGGKVLSDTATLKYNQVVQTVDTMRELGADIPQDYKTAKAAVQGNITVPSSTTGSSGSSTNISPNPVITLP